MNDDKNADSTETTVRVRTLKAMLASGELVEVTEAAAAIGCQYRFVLTRGVFDACVAGPPAEDGGPCPERLNALLWGLAWGIILRRSPETVIGLGLCCLDERLRPCRTALKVVSGFDDDAQPCLTVMLPHEDESRMPWRS